MSQMRIDRRSLLKGVVGGAMAAAGATVPAGAVRAGEGPCTGLPAGRWKKSLKIGMVEGDMSLTDKFRMLRDIGFDGVEMECPCDIPVEEVLKARDASGLCIPGVVCGVLWRTQLNHPDPAVRQQGVENLTRALREARAFGAETCLVIPAVVSKAMPYEQAYRLSQAELRKVIPVARELGIVMACENVWNNFLLSPIEAARYVDELDSPFLRWYFDVGNVLRNGWPEHWIRTLGRRIVRVDIKEYSLAKRDQEGLWKGFEVELLEGDCDWPEVMKAFREIGYVGWGSAEVPGGGRDRLRSIAERMDRIFALYPAS